YLFANAQRFAALPLADVAMELATEFLRVADDEAPRCKLQRTGIADLAARLRVEGRAVQDNRGGFARLQRVHRAAIAQDCQHLAVFGFQRVVTEELRWLQSACHVRRQLRLAFEL